MTVRDVEEKGLQLVIAYERAQGRTAERVFNCGCDLRSGDRLIEVKCRAGHQKRVLGLNQYNLLACEKGGDRWFLYVVTGVDEREPELMILTQAEVLARKKERRQWRFTLKKNDFDKSEKLRQ